MARRRLTTFGGALLTATGIYAARGDFASAATDLASTVSSNVLGIAVAALGLAVIAWANWNELKSLLGFGRSNGDWVRQIREWTLEKRGWALTESSSDKKAFRIAFKVPHGSASDRSVTVWRDAGNENVAVVMGLNLSPAHKAQLARLPRDQQSDLFDDVMIALASRVIDTEIQREGGLVVRIAVIAAFPADSALTEYAFIEKVQDVDSAWATVNALVNKAARRAPPEATPMPVVP